MSKWANTNTATISTSASGDTRDLANDVELANIPEDSTSDLSWSPAADHLAVASWNKQVRIYDLTANTVGDGIALMDFEGPALSCSWSKDGRNVIGASTDKTARLLDLGANGAPSQQVAAHEEAIRAVRYFETKHTNAPMIVTGSWDKTVKFWDLRKSTPVSSLECKNKVYSMDLKDSLLVIATAEQHTQLVDLNQLSQFLKSENTLKHQLRVVSCFPDASGYIVGGIEGRCALNWLSKFDQGKNFSFKCQRDPLTKTDHCNVYSVNAISMHPNKHVFTTAGSDGTFSFWDKDRREKVKAYPAAGGSIPATAFNKDGSIFAYAISYDWSKGYLEHTPQYPNKVMLHTVKPDDIKKPSTRKPY